MPSNTHLASGAMQRASSYSTCNATPLMSGRHLIRAVLHDQPSAYDSHIREPSYYTTYPIATPSTMSHDASPPMLSSTSSPSPPLSAQATGNDMPARQPSLSPLNSAVQRDDSSSSVGRVLMAQHKSSSDRLQTQTVERAPSISSVQIPTPGMSDSDGSSRANSPHPSSLGFSSRQSAAYPAYPRPYSMTSISSSRQALSGPYGGAPHQGRPVQLEMPRLLGARPDQNGDFFRGTARPTEGFHPGLEEARLSPPRMLSGYRW